MKMVLAHYRWLLATGLTVFWGILCIYLFVVHLMLLSVFQIM
jgi:hypothetical protein